jgi:hypothetical protein
MSTAWDKSEIILDRINEVLADETIQGVLNGTMAALVNCVLTHNGNDKEYPREFVEDLLTRIRTLCLREWIREQGPRTDSHEAVSTIVPTPRST